MKSIVTACLLLLAPATGAATWVVDASGGGHFTSIQAAIDAAAPGDVLLVKPGVYSAFTLGKDLSILGPAAGTPPYVLGQTLLLMDNAEIAGLRFNTLEIVGASGVVILDDIHVDGFGGVESCDGIQIEDCAQVHVLRSLLHGKDGDFLCESLGVVIVDSVVTLTGSTVVGGTGWSDTFDGYPGLEGLDIQGESAVLLAQTSVIGGNGGSPQILFGGFGGSGAPAIRLNWDDPSAPATCTVRGSFDTTLQGGAAGEGTFANPAFYAVWGWGSLTLSGVSWSPEELGGGLDVEIPALEQPFINLIGDDGPSAFKRLNLHGPAGTSLLLFASLNTAQLALPGPVDGTIWLDLGTPLLIQPFVLQGQEMPVNLTFTMPASVSGLEGLLVTFQGFAAGMGGSGNHLASNPAHLLVR